MPDTVIALPKAEENNDKENEFFLQKKSDKSKMETKIFFKKHFIFFIGFLTLLIAMYFLKYGIQEEMEEVGIPKARNIRAHSTSSQNPSIELIEFQTPFFAFFMDAAASTGEHFKPPHKKLIEKYVKNKPKNHFFEIKKDKEDEIDGKYSLMVIEKDHKNSGKSVLLEYATFDDDCFEEGYCMIGKFNGENGNNIGYIYFNSYFKTFNGSLDDSTLTFSKNFIVLLIKNADDHDNMNFDAVNRMKLILNEDQISYLKQNVVQAVFIGNFGSEDKRWIKSLKNKFNYNQKIKFNIEYGKSTSLCGNQWISKTDPTPAEPNQCDNVENVLSSELGNVTGSNLLNETNVTEIDAVTFQPTSSASPEAFLETFSAGLSSTTDCRPFIVRSRRLLELNPEDGSVKFSVSSKIDIENMCNTTYQNELGDNDNGVYGLLIVIYDDEKFFINNYIEFRANATFRNQTKTSFTMDIKNETTTDIFAYGLIELLNGSTTLKNAISTDGLQLFEPVEKLLQHLIIDFYVEKIKYDSIFQRNDVIAKIMDQMGITKPAICNITQNTSDPLFNPWIQRRKIRNKC